jgi:plastocyanin
MKSLLALSILLVIFVSGFSISFAEVTIVPATGSGAPGCEETADGCYLPNAVNVDVGEYVIFKNTDSAAHTFTSGHPGDGPDGLFDTSLLMVNNTFEWIPQTEGNQPYFCMVHPWMIGMIVVGEGSSNIPVPTPVPIIDDPLESENEKLKQDIMELKLENKQLKNKITSLNSEIDSLKDQIVSMTKEFVDSLQQLNEWFRSQLN